MIRILLAVVDVIPVAVILVPLFVLLYHRTLGRDFRKTVLYCLFCLYMAAVFSLVGIPNVTYIRPDVNWNLIPGFGLVQDLKNSFLNVLLFVPLGFLLPVLWEPYRKPTYTVSYGFGLSLLIELLQMLTYRATDVNDLITNVLGTLVGFVLSKFVSRRNPAIGNEKQTAYALCGLSFGVMFFVHPFLSPMIWDRIL